MVAKTGIGIVTDVDPELFGEALERLSTDGGLSARLAEEGPLTVQEMFSWDEIAVRMEAVYKEARSGK